MIISERKEFQKKEYEKDIKKKKFLRFFIIASIIIALLIAVVIILVLVFRNKKIEKNDKEESGKQIKEPEEFLLKEKKLEKEFEIVTKVGDLKRVSVVQISSDQTKLDDNIIETQIKRKTNYDIYVISESEPDEDNKLFYSKMYTSSISIVSECISSDGSDCEPHKLVDLTQEKKNKSNSRALNNVEDFKDIPIALCLFNITDNNFITSMTCPESLSESKKNEMILDLYFFRPPAIQRASKEEDNITITIDKDEAKNRIYIRERNGGPCNIYDSLGSMCTTEMNTTTDLKGNLLSYDESAITNITKDENNSFIKIKTTNLLDVSEKIQNLDPLKYKNSLDKLFPMLQPYMKVDIHFTTDNFTDLYNIVQEKSKSKKKKYLLKKDKKVFRNLMEYAKEFTKEQELFLFPDPGGIKISLNLKADSGINTQAMRSYSNLNFNEEEKKLSALEEFTDIQKILDELIELSKAGNHLATELYEKINAKLQGITSEISLKIKTLNDLLKYYDLSEVFDSTLSLDSINILPITIIEESNSLINKLKELYNNIKSGNTKNNADKLNDNVYNYNKQLHILIKNIFDSLKELTNTLNSKSNKITEVTTYYLNHTSSSYINSIQEAENILENYFKNEYTLIYPQVEKMLKEFEQNSIEALEKEKKIINNLRNKIENKNFTIKLANDEDYKKIVLNLYNSEKYITDIINKIKEYFKDSIGIKDSGYFVSNYDINLNNKSFSPILSEAKEVAQKLDKDEYIDKKFDEIMINFRENYTNIIKYMEKQKLEQFPLDENTLKDSLFTSKDKNEIETKMTKFRVEISNKIKEENNFYMDKIRNYISKFLNENLNNLNTLISDLNILFSEESLNELSKLFENAFYSCLNKIETDIKKNEVLSKQYFDQIYNVMKYNYRYNNYRYYYYYYIKTNAYVNKYSTFIANLDYSKNYINNQLYLDILNEYKSILTKIRETLQSIKNNKITDKYPDFSELEFYDNHIREIDKLFNRLNKYWSDNIFNNKYLNIINENKTIISKYIDSIKSYIIKSNSNINYPFYDTYYNYQNDYCSGYRRKRCYGCSNCAWYYYYFSVSYCYKSTYTNNYLSLVKTSIKSDPNLIQLNQVFNNFYTKINQKINDYNSIIKYLQGNFTEIKKETLDKNITLNYLISIEDSVNSILSEKYGDEIIKASYNYYQILINERLKIILDNVTEKWNNSFNSLISEIDKNYNNFNYSTYEFFLMASVYEALITKNITRDYFYSIVNFQKTEFNYTISYYYNYYIKIINEAFQYIISTIPKNERGFNDILDQRKKEINDTFNKFIKNITNSKIDSLSNKKQIELLEVIESNFFRINSILTDNILKTKELLKSKVKELSEYEGNEGNEISLISRFYLENKENGKQIEQFYDPVKHEEFVYLNLEKFKEILIQNWIFDQDDFINRLNLTLFNTNKEIKNELSTEKEKYLNKIEYEITKYFVDESIENKINNLYLSEIKDLTKDQLDKINTYINEIINKVKEKISNETTRITTTSTSYNSNYSKIENTIKEFKNKIFSEINSTIFNVLEEFYKNIYDNVYTKCIKSRLDEYISQTRNATISYDEYVLLNSTYNIGEIINNIVENVVKNYKEVTLKKINSKYQEYYEKINKTVNLNNLKKVIENQIDNEYNSKLLNALKKFAIYTPGDSQYTEYDFTEENKTEINSIIKEKIYNISQQILFTKGNNSMAKINCELDFSTASIDVIIPICDSFKKFLSSEKQEQKNEINQIIQNIIKSNFDNLINNIIPTFGNQFFDRIIKYNENFKITNLYDNLKYSLSQTLAYYITLNIYGDVEALPKDLKIRLYNLNNLDLTVEKKNKQVLELLEKKISEFIFESKINIIEKYMSYLQEDISIQRSFSNLILEKINDNLIEMQPIMEKNYQDMLEKYLKERLINSYSKVMNDKTKEMAKIVSEEREKLRTKIDDLFSLDSDKVLNEVNQKINNTLDSINEYNNYLGNFVISNDIKDYLNNYGSSIIQPIFGKFKIELNKITKDKVSVNIDKNSKNIESLSPKEFINKTNDIYQYFNINYIINISNSINSYGTEEYRNNLDIERTSKRNMLRRRLDGTQTEDEIVEESKERIKDRTIEENFKDILDTSKNTKNYFDSLEVFTDFDKKIKKYKNNLNIAYKTSKELIKKNEYDEQIDNFLNEKLDNLTNISNYYYDMINQSYSKLREFLNNSLIEIDNTLNQCANITYNVFNEEYEKIANKTHKVNTKYSTNTAELNQIKYTKKTEHKTNKVTASLSDFREYGEFQFELVFEGTTIKKPKIIARIVDKSRPKKMKLSVSSPFGTCGETINQLDVEFNDANYTMNIEYISNSSNINITTFTYFEKYKYSTEVYQIGESNETESFDVMGIEIEYQLECKKKKEKVFQNKYFKEVDEKIFNETNVIQG